MRLTLPILAAAVIAIAASVLAPVQSEAAPFASQSNLSAVTEVENGVFQRASYYGGYRDRHYDDHDDYNDHDYHGGYDRYDHGHHCHRKYKKRWVCDQTIPRCFRQRECIWHYGREYCRYVKKCVGGEKYCKWIKVPVKDCW